MGGIRPSGLHLNKPVVFGLLGITLVVFIVSRLYMGGGLGGGVASRIFQSADRPAPGVNPSGAGRGAFIKLACQPSRSVLFNRFLSKKMISSDDQN